MEKLIDQAVKDIRLVQLARPGDTKMIRLWLEKMYLKGQRKILSETKKDLEKLLKDIQNNDNI